MQTTYFFYPGNDDVFYDALKDINNSKFKKKRVFVRKNIYTKREKEINYIKNKITWKINKFSILNLVNVAFSPMLRINKDLKTKGKKCFVFSNLTIKMLPKSLIKKLIRRQDCTVILYLLDASNNPLCKEAINFSQSLKFDAVYTFDSEDAKKYNFKHIYYIYSKFDVDTDVKLKKKLTFFGSDKGRLPTILKILDITKNKKISSFFSLVGIDGKDKDKLKKYSNVQINTPVSYKKLIHEIQNYDVLLDIVASEQTGLSYRIIEAICYNKKLLTNNKKILDFPYYNSKYMQYFDKVEDIDWSFVVNDTPVDYNYKNNYSPIKFLEKISESYRK